MAKMRKIRCWGCHSLDVIKWGKQGGKQRYKCKNCGLLLTRNNSLTSYRNRFVWFRLWIEGKQTFSELAKRSGYSEHPKTLLLFLFGKVSKMENQKFRESKFTD